MLTKLFAGVYELASSEHFLGSQREYDLLRFESTLPASRCLAGNVDGEEQSVLGYNPIPNRKSRLKRVLLEEWLAEEIGEMAASRLQRTTNRQIGKLKIRLPAN